jgi:peptide chain release factor
VIWVLLSAARGPAECRLAVTGLIEAAIAEARAAGLAAELLHAEEAPHGPVSAVLAVDGPGAEGWAESWRGTLQWICRSPLRPEHGRKNWFVSGTVLRPPEPSSGGFDPRELRWETFRATGAGGQHVNRTESAVRVTHLPTGIAVPCASERSQHRNRAIALALLSRRLCERQEDEERRRRGELWSCHHHVERGASAARRVYVGPSFRRRR